MKSKNVGSNKATNFGGGESKVNLTSSGSIISTDTINTPMDMDMGEKTNVRELRKAGGSAKRGCRGIVIFDQPKNLKFRIFF